MVSTQYIKRHGVALTKKQFAILETLRKAHEAERPLVKLEIRTKHDENTLRLMQERDWIIESTKVFLGERRFAITSRGLKLMKLMDTPSGRPAPATDLCAQCGKKPRAFTSGGYRSAYCQEHHNACNRARYANKRSNVYRADLPCSSCKKAPRSVSPNGRVYAYCVACRRIRNIEARAARAHKAHQAIANGTPRTCSKCHKHPVHVTPKYSHPVCKTCLAERARVSRQRQKHQRRQRKIAAFLKRG